MSASATLTLYEVLGKYFDNTDDAKTAVDAVNGISESKTGSMEEKLLTKEDKIDILREMKTDKVELFREMKSDKAELTTLISKSKVETIFWFIGAFIVHFVLNVLYDLFF